MKVINDKINHIALKFFAGNNSKFAGVIGTSEANIRNYRKNTLPKIDFVINLHKKLNISYEWLFSDSYEQNGDSLIINTDNENYTRSRRIPLYDTMYGIRDEKPEISEENIMKPVAHIDAGSWFPEATAAVRHYGEHMAEYPNGAILVVREVSPENISSGVNYVIVKEKGYFTLRLYPGDDKEHLLGYSTGKADFIKANEAHDGIVLPVADVLRLYIVLGCVIR